MTCGSDKPNDFSIASNGVRSSQAISIRRDISDSESVFDKIFGTLQVYDLFTKLVLDTTFSKNRMIGKIRRKLISLAPTPHLKVVDVVCPICDRPIPDSQKDAHHLIPKSKGGKTTEYLHRICHRQIHALFNETELAVLFNTASALQGHPEMQRFIHWVKSKPNHFYEKSRKSSRLKEI